MKLRVSVAAQTFEVEVGDLNARPVIAVIDGQTFEVWPEEGGQPTPAPLSSQAPAETRPAATAPLPAAGAPVNKLKAAVAPIPGVILSVAVKAGDAVSFGQELCVLEAMKMKNVIRANRAGTIAAVCVAAGDQVRHNQVLVEYSD